MKGKVGRFVYALYFKAKGKLYMKQKRVRIFINNGIVEGAFSLDPDIQVEIVDFDSEKFSLSEYDELYDEIIKNPDMTKIQPVILPEE